MKRNLLAAVAAAATLFAGASTAQAPLEAYGRLPAFDLVEVSPSGDRLAFVSVAGEERILLITEITGQEDLDQPLGSTLLGRVRAGETKVRSLHWMGETHLLAVTTTTTRLSHFDRYRGEYALGQIYDIPSRRLNTAFAGTRSVMPVIGSVIIRTFNGQPALFTEGLVVDERNRMDLFRIDPSSGRGVSVERGDYDVRNYVLDANAEPMARSRYATRTGRWELQRKSGGFWRTVWSTEALLDQPWLAGLGSREGAVAVYAQLEGDDDFELYEVDADGQFARLLDRTPDLILRSPLTHRIIGAGYREGESYAYHFFDDSADRAWSAIHRAFQDRIVRLEGWSADMRTAVVFTEGAGDAGTYHLIDLDARRADILGEAYPDITPDQVAEMQPLSYLAADGMTIPGYLTLPPGREARDLPLVVLPHGGPAARDVLGFDWWAQAIASRGYAVLQPNFRGSDGLGRAHLEAGYGEWGRKMQSDLSDGVRHLAEAGTIDPARVCIVGASYGGYAALAGVTLEQDVYRCAVSVAGVSDLRRMVQWTADRQGRRNTASVRYWNRFMGAERFGDRSLDDRSPAHQAARAGAPILLMHGMDDTVVPFDQSSRMADALGRAGRPHEFIRLTGEDHWLSRAETRQRMLAETVRFLEAHNPAD